MSHPIPEKTELLEKLKQGGFDVPDFIYVPPQHFRDEDFGALESFLERHRKSYKVIARSAHLAERFFKGGRSTLWRPMPTWAASVTPATR
jgi:hypothetical protein